MVKDLIDRFLPVVIWAALIFTFSATSHPYVALPREWSEPANPVDPSVPNTAEKIGQFLHAGEYAILSFLVARAILRKAVNSTLFLTAAGAFSFLYALSDEIHQSFVPGRTFQIADLILDFIGIVVGIGLYLFLIRKKGV